jgi:hypothetical protein
MIIALLPKFPLPDIKFRGKKNKKQKTPKHVRSQFGVGLRTFWGSRPAGLQEKIDTKQSVHKPKLYFL